MAKPLLTCLLALATLLPALPGRAQEGAEPALRPSSTFHWLDQEAPTAPSPAATPPRPREGLSIQRQGVSEVGDPLHRMPTVDLTEDAEDVWDRIRRGFAMPDLNSDLVTEQQIFFLNRPGYLKRVFERGRRYLYYIVGELERRGMPTELALLPMVESAYNPMAYSRARASGLWQFIPSTGRTYNLTQNAWVDERRDVIASTNAALDYLQTIYEMHGDWQLALASYNWGEGAVGRAVQKNQAAGRSTEYASLNMPNETRNYVPKLQALKNIIAQPELFNFTLPYVANRPYFVTVEMPATLDLATAARMADTPLDEFMALNPSYRKPVIPKGNQSLVIPAEKEAVFRANLTDLNPGAPRWKAYEVGPGERIDAIAARLGVSSQQLRELNGLAAGSRIAEGQTLLVPAGADVSAAMAAARLISENDASVSPPSPSTKSESRSASKDANGHTSSAHTASGTSSAPPKSTGQKTTPATHSTAAPKPAVAQTKKPTAPAHPPPKKKQQQ